MVLILLKSHIHTRLSSGETIFFRPLLPVETVYSRESLTISDVNDFPTLPFSSVFYQE